MPKHPSKSQYFRKIPKNRFEDMELTADGSNNMWSFLSKLEKEWNLHGWSTKLQHSLGVFYGGGGGGGCSRGVTHFYRSSLAMIFESFRISKTNLNSVEYLKRHFLNHLACFFWNSPLIERWTFCSRRWDIYPALCIELELFPELPQNKICDILHPKYTSFSCFLIICTSAAWKSLF